MELYPSLKPLKLIRPKPMRVKEVKGWVKVGEFNERAFSQLFKKEKPR